MTHTAPVWVQSPSNHLASNYSFELLNSLIKTRLKWTSIEISQITDRKKKSLVWSSIVHWCHFSKNWKQILVVSSLWGFLGPTLHFDRAAVDVFVFINVNKMFIFLLAKWYTWLFLSAEKKDDKKKKDDSSCNFNYNRPTKEKNAVVIDRYIDIDIYTESM